MGIEGEVAERLVCIAMMLVVVVVVLVVVERVCRLMSRLTVVTCPHQAGAPARLDPAESEGTRWC